MSIERTLEMGFNTQLNKSQTIRVYAARADATASEINAVMDNVITRNVFEGGNGALSSKKTARLITRQVDDFNIT